MRIYLMTDMEGCAGMITHDDWVIPAGRYYEAGKELLTLEVNAAVDGFIAAGVTEIVVADGHGYGGIDGRLLDARARLMRGWPGGFPFLLDRSYDAVAWVGQHAKAGTPYSHITHTQSFHYVDLAVNGVSIGELGQFAMCASELGIPAIFAAGEKALAAEAAALIPGIETVAVKEGTTPGSGDELSTEKYAKFHLAAIHLHPVRARELIRAGAARAVRTALERKGDATYGIVPLTKPFRRRAVFRQDANNPHRTSADETHPDSLIALLNLPFDRHALEADGGTAA